MLVSVSQIHKGFSGILRAETINGTRQFEGMVGLSSPENAFFLLQTRERSLNATLHPYPKN